jgi:hypothetical protein
MFANCLWQSTLSCIALCRHRASAPDSVVQTYWADDCTLVAQGVAYSLWQHEAHYPIQNGTLMDSLPRQFELNVHNHV